MHDSVMRWVRKKVREHDLRDLNVLEVGSYDENGSVRSMFTGGYLGVDMRDGPGVDRVADASALPFGIESFDFVISTEMLEHDKTFWLSMREMGRVLKPGGLLLITTRGNGFPLHAYPDDYFRFMPSAAPLLLELASCDVVETLEDPDPQAPGIFALGRKR